MHKSYYYYYYYYIKGKEKYSTRVKHLIAMVMRIILVEVIPLDLKYINKINL